MERVLFIRLRLLGDIVLTIPSIKIFKHQFPGAHLSYVVEEPYAEFARLIPGIDQVIVVPRKMSIKEMWNFRKKIRNEAFEAVVDFHSGPRSAQLTWLSGIKLRIGYRTPNRNWAYTHFIPRNNPDSPNHSVYNQARLLEHLGCLISCDSIPPLPALTIDRDLVSNWTDISVLETRGNKAVFHVGAGNKFRDWGLINFERLAAQLISRNWSVFLIGNSSDEKEKGDYLSARLPIFNLTGKLSIPELIYVISRSSVFLGADSGPMHLASLTSTPIVALFGPNIPVISGPWRNNNVSIIRHIMNCQPCEQRRCIYDIIPCMKNITTDEVYEKITRYSQ